MFTGILKAKATVVELTDATGLRTFVLEFEKGNLEELKTGASISVDGVCLTAAKIEGERVYFDAMEETLVQTTIGELEVGSEVNVERSFKVGDEIGGHIVSGHVTGKAKIIDVDVPENNHVISYEIEKKFMKYVLPKGFIALNGASLTIVDTDQSAGTFNVHLIPETLDITTFGQKVVGDNMNFEIDSRTQAIVDTVERMVQEGQIEGK